MFIIHYGEDIGGLLALGVLFFVAALAGWLMRDLWRRR
jgi:hypothetical protein